MRILLCAFFAALLPAADTAADHLRRAAEFHKRQDYGNAIPELRRALALDPNLLEAHGLLGEALLAQGYTLEAIPHLERAQRDGLMGVALFHERRAAHAITKLLTALEKKPDDPDLLYFLGKASSVLMTGSFDRLMNTSPNSARAHQLIAESHLGQRRPDAAESAYRKALEQRPDLRGIHLALGKLKESNGELDEAEKEFRAEAALSPGDGETVWRLGSLLLKKGRAKEALVELERSNRLRPQMIENLHDLARASLLENKLEQAEKAWLEIVSIDDRSDSAANAHLQLSLLYRKQGKQKEADRHLGRYRELKR
jgi:tetratricopeptide (TPR) repeat protein